MHRLRSPFLRHLAGWRALAWLAVAGAGGLWTSPALACKCMQAPPAQAFEQAVAVFEGRVVEIIEPAPNSTGPAHARTVRLQAIRSWKGVESESVELTTAADSAACGFAFAKELNYLVYAFAEEGHLRVSACSRTRPMTDAAEDLQTMGMGATPVDPTLASDDKPAAPPKAAAQPAQRAAVHARGGCAGCSTASDGANLGSTLVPWLLAAAGLMLSLRRGRVRSPGR